jgi:hypothetical protein
MNKNNGDKPKRKRGRPRKNESSIKSKVKITEPIKNEEIILHMSLKKSDIEKKDFYKASIQNNSSITDTTENKVFTLDDIDIVEDNNSNKNLMKELKKKNELIKQLKEKINKLSNVYETKNRTVKQMNLNFIKNLDGTKYPEKTDICCWWCTEKFDTIPIGLPVKCVNNVFSVLGVFCSFNCAAAYNAKESNYTMWNRYSLLHKLQYKMTNINTQITIAPSKETLKKFGGHLTIEQFRNKEKDKLKEYSLIIPPIISIIPFIEEDNGYHKKKTKKNKMDYLSKLTVKRKKPLPNENYNLMHSMGLKST